MRKRKAQMFIVTTVFLVELIFAFQGMLFDYTLFDPATPYQTEHNLEIIDIRNAFQETLDSSSTCEETLGNFAELKADIIRGEEEQRVYDTDINYYFDCKKSSLRLYINVIEKDKTSSADFTLVNA